MLRIKYKETTTKEVAMVLDEDNRKHIIETSQKSQTKSIFCRHWLSPIKQNNNKINKIKSVNN